MKHTNKPFPYHRTAYQLAYSYNPPAPDYVAVAAKRLLDSDRGGMILISTNSLSGSSWWEHVYTGHRVWLQHPY